MPAANIPPMVTASTPSALEINLRRLMIKCDGKVRGSDKILQGRERNKYAMNIRALKEMLTELEDELTRSGKADIAALKEYAEKIESLAAAVDGSVSITPNYKSLQQARMIIPPSSMNIVEQQYIVRSKSERRPHVSPESSRDAYTGNIEEERRSSIRNQKDELFGLRERRLGKDTDLDYNSLGQNNREPLDSRDSLREQGQVEAALQNDRAQREEMEAGISRLMQQLRHNALAIHQTLADEQKSGLLDDADHALDTNISRLGKERTRLELYSKQSRKTTWMIWGIVFGVSIVFVFMFFIIRIF
ncbi:hypothetical protein BX616_008140 [Lobosporangium transversale]|nr:hypothetical protein BX616_008140 [Lobosporangium transversale]